MQYIIIIGLIVLAWCPWLSKEEALKVIDMRVAEMKREYKDLCAMTIHKETIRKVPFGYTEKVSYDCTITDEFYGVSQSTDTVFITFYSGTLGMPQQTVTKDHN